MIQKFVSEVTESNFIFVLKTSENYASVESQFEEDDEGVPIEVMCIWSSEKISKENIQDEWAEYQSETIGIREFLEDWCIGIFNDGLAFCLNLHEDTEPMEIQPLDLAFEIANSLKRKNSTISLASYKNIEDYIQAIQPYVIRPS